MNWQEETKTSWNAFKSLPQHLPVLINDTTQIYNALLNKTTDVSGMQPSGYNSEVPIFIDELPLSNLAQKLHLNDNQAT